METRDHLKLNDAQHLFEMSDRLRFTLADRE